MKQAVTDYLDGRGSSPVRSVIALTRVVTSVVVMTCDVTAARRNAPPPLGRPLIH